MKVLRRIAISIGIITLIAALLLGFKLGSKYYKSYQFERALSHTVLDKDLTAGAYQKSRELKDGQILSKEPFQLSEVPPIWERLSENDSLLTQYQYLNQINFYLIVYKSDSLLVNGIIAEPKAEGRFPVILFNRGSNKKVGKVAKGSTLFSLLQFSRLVAEGHVMVASCYREADEFGGKDLNDVLNLTSTIKEIDKADTTRVGMLGWSRGGMMTYLALQKSSQIKTAVVGNGPTDLFSLLEERPGMESQVCARLIPNFKANRSAALKKRSVIYWADELEKNSSLLILSGSQDQKVNPNQAKKIAKILTEMDYDFELREFDTDHKFSGKKEELNQLLSAWFKERL